MVTLGEMVPSPHFRERHERRIAAPPAAVWKAIEELSLGDLPISRTLMRVRSLGRQPAVHGRLIERGPVPTLAIDPERALVGGGVLQPWKLRGGATPPTLDAEQLRAFAEPGWVKVGFDFVLVPDAGGTRLSTETRVAATDARTRRIFRVYWLAIRAGSGLIRRDLLRAVARNAEA
jgi:hypothetical protein